MKVDLDPRQFSNGCISETKKATEDPLVPKFSYRRGLSPTLSWKWPRATLSPSFGPFFERNRLFRVFSGCFRFPMISEKRSEYGPDTFFHVGKNKIAVPAKTSAELQNLWTLSFWLFQSFSLNPSENACISAFKGPRDKEQARKPRSYASPKLWLTGLLTGVKCRATSVAKNAIIMWKHKCVWQSCEQVDMSPVEG